MSYLIYVNELGPNYKGDNIYEFIFSDSSKDIWGESWESKPSNGYPLPPDLEHIKKVGVLKNDLITMSVIQNSDYFSVYDATDGVVSLAWEDANSSFVVDSKYKRLVFQYGETVQSVEDKLYERDIVLNWEKNLVQDETY